MRDVLSFEGRRMLNLVVGIYVCVCGAIMFCFGLLTNRMKEQFSLSQGELTTVSTFATVFGTFAVPAGFVWDRWGPRPVLVASGVLVILGFGGMALSFSGYCSGSLPVLSVWVTLMALPSSWMDIASVMTNMFHFPHNNGDVVVLQKTFMGLGSAMFTTFYRGWFFGDLVGLCWFQAASSAAVMFIAAGVLDLPEYVYRQRSAPTDLAAKLVQTTATSPRDEYLQHVPADRRRLRVGFVLLAVMVGYLTVTALVTGFDHQALTPLARILIAAACMVLTLSFLALPLIPDSSSSIEGTTTSLQAADGSSLKDEAAVVRYGATTTETDVAHEEHRGARRALTTLLRVSDDEEIKYEHSLWLALRRLDLWLLWWYAFCIWGVGTVVISNSAQIYRAINLNEFNDDMNALFVAFLGLGSAGGRVVCGAVHQMVLAPRRLTCSWLFPIPPVLMIVALLLFLCVPPNALVVPFALTGAAFGWSWAITVLVCRRMLRNDLGKQYNFIFTAPMLSTIFLNRYVFGSLFDDEARRQGHRIHCSGLSCVATSILIYAALTATAVGASLLLHYRWLVFLRDQTAQRRLEQQNTTAAAGGASL